ncbi:hypothetical protein ACOMHN_043358 [Nucella lapillus]
MTTCTVPFLCGLTRFFCPSPPTTTPSQKGGEAGGLCHRGGKGVDDEDSPQCRQASSWKFWRKMSTKRPDRKTRWSAKNAAGVGNVKVTDGVKPRDLDLGDEAGVVTEAAPATSGSLPDVLDKAVLTRSISLKAPPKPPRLFLCRSSSLNQYQPRSAEPASFYRPVDSEPGLREKAEVDEEPIYVNAAFGAALKSGLSGNDRIIPPSLHNHSQHHHVSYRESQRQKTGPRHSKDEGLTLMPSEVRERSGRVRDTPGGGQRGAGEARETLEESRQKAREARESAGDDRRLLAWDYRGRPTDTVPRPPRLSSSSLSLSNIYYSLPHRPKTRQRVLSSHLMPHGPRPRGRTRSVDQPEQRHQTILHSVLDLVCQRWDPFPLLDPLHAAGVLTAMDLQAFRGHPDRKLICENVLNAVGNGDYSVFLAFLEVLRGAGSQRDILHVLQAMKDMDSVIHDLPGPPQEEEEDEEDQILAEEKILSFEVGYLAPDGVSLKPVVELERVRSGERRTLPRTPQGSMPMPDPCSQPGGPGEGGSSPPSACVTGHVMINVCITGHSLSGSRALALAQVLRTQDCIVELRIGKTQLCSADVAALCGALRHNSTLASLDLRLNSLSHVGASAIASVLSHTQVLQQLNLSSTGLEVAGCRDVLAAVTLNRTLAELDLSFLNVGDSVCDAVRDVLRANGALRRLRLRSNNFSSVGIAIIAEGLHRNRSLLELDLSRNILGDGGIEALARYIPESALTEISLENCNVTCAACGVLSQMIISSKRLRVLDLSVNPLGDEGVQGLAAALERSSVLHSLALNMCGVSNDGFSALLDVLEKNTSIWLLKLCYNLLGRQHLNPAATSDNLRYRLRIVTSSKPKLKILLWGNSFSDLEADDRGSRRYSSLR